MLARVLAQAPAHAPATSAFARAWLIPGRRRLWQLSLVFFEPGRGLPDAWAWHCGGGGVGRVARILLLLWDSQFSLLGWPPLHHGGAVDFAASANDVAVERTEEWIHQTSAILREWGHVFRKQARAARRGTGVELLALTWAGRDIPATCLDEFSQTALGIAAQLRHLVGVSGEILGPAAKQGGKAALYALARSGWRLPAGVRQFLGVWEENAPRTVKQRYSRLACSYILCATILTTGRPYAEYAVPETAAGHASVLCASRAEVSSADDHAYVRRTAEVIDAPGDLARYQDDGP